MFTLLSHFVFLFSAGPKAVDTIPSCIVYMKTESGKLLTKYDYKGQYWFSFRDASIKVIDNTSDKMTTITFYDSTCHVVARWTKGGIAGLNKVSPDTIDKKKIIALWAEQPDTAALKPPVNASASLPDSILKIVVTKKINWIEETNCKELTLYRFEKITAGLPSSKIEFTGLYYNKEGKAITKVGNCINKFWWHLSNGKFVRTQFRPGYR